MASAALDGAPLVAAAVDEIDWAEGFFDIGLRPVRYAADGRWRPGPNGVSLDAVDAVAGVVDIVRHAVGHRSSIADALRYAVSLGGDTDTAAAIAGGILGGRLTGTPDIPWLDRVDLPEAGLLDDLSAGLAALRTGRR